MKRSTGPNTFRGNRLQITVQLDPDQVSAIDRLSAFKRTSRAALVRESIDFFLAANTSRIATTPAIHPDTVEVA